MAALSYSLSSLGGCPRALVAARLGYDQMLALDFMRVAAREGRRHEPWIAEDLREVSDVEWVSEAESCKACGREGSHVELPMSGYRVIGHVDRWVQYYGELRLAEFKALGAERAKQLAAALEGERLRFVVEFPEYAYQISGYMFASGVPALYVVKNRNSGFVKVFPMDDPPLNLEAVALRVSQIELCAAAGQLPACAYGPGSIERRMCRYRYLCGGADVVKGVQQ